MLYTKLMNNFYPLQSDIQVQSLALKKHVKRCFRLAEARGIDFVILGWQKVTVKEGSTVRSAPHISSLIPSEPLHFDKFDGIIVSWN